MAPMTRTLSLVTALTLFVCPVVGCSGDDEHGNDEPLCADEASCDEEAERGDSAEGEAQRGGPCVSDAECSYNGTCTMGRCACHTPWRGERCHALEMGEVDKGVYGYREGFPMTTSWGGSVQYDEASETYVMLVSEYVEECANWGWNSAVVLATSDAPEGPYEKQYRLFGVMSHEAMLSRGPDGEWVVYFTASVSSEGLPASGEDDYADDEVCVRVSAEAPCVCPGDPDKGSRDPTWMSHTMSPLEPGSWSEPVMIFDPANHFTDTFNDGSPAESIDANFNGVILDDGSFVGLWRTWNCVEDLVGDKAEAYSQGSDACFSVPHPVQASDWEDPSTYTLAEEKGALTWLFESEYTLEPTERLALGIEDPMVYIDSRSPGVYHAIFHEMFVPTDNVSHAYSLDGEDWIYTGPVFETDPETKMPMVTFTDGTETGLACERPQLLVDKGVPTHIIIGGIPKGLNTDPAYPDDAEADLREQASLTGWPGGATMVIPLKPLTPR